MTNREPAFPIVVMSKGCTARMHTMQWLDRLELPYMVVTHSAADAERIGAACKGTVIATGLPDLVANRDLVFKLLPDNAWFVGMDDNIRRVTRVRDDYYGGEEIDQKYVPHNARDWREVYRTEVTSEVLSLVSSLVERCKQYGTIYGGFASMENPFFRQRKWSSVRFVKSKLFVMQNVPGLRWGGGNYAHDSWMSAYVVAKYGCVAVNNWVHPEHKMYEQGGLGHGRERRPHLDPVLDEICAQFHGLVAKGKGENTALRFLRTTPESVRRWQVENPFFEYWRADNGS